MSEKSIKPGVKAILEYGPLLVFFLAYILLKNRTFLVGEQAYNGFIAATAIFVPLLALATFLQWRLAGKISKMQIITLILVVFFGGLSVWFNDERFFKMKPTMIYLIFAGLLGFGLLRGESYLEAVMGESLPLQPAGWMLLTKRLIVFFLALALFNEVIWRNFSTGTWVTFKTFGLTLGTFAFFMSQMRVFNTYAVEEKNGKDS